MIQIPGFLTARVLIYAAAVAAVFVAGMWFHKQFSDRTIAKLELAASQREAEWSAQVAARAAEARTREAELQSVVDAKRKESEDALETIREQGRLLAVARSDIGRMRGNLAAYAAGRGSEDTVAACQNRAGRLSDLLAEGAGLLDEGRQALAEAAVAADERGVKLLACIDAWPAR